MGLHVVRATGADDPKVSSCVARPHRPMRRPDVRLGCPLLAPVESIKTVTHIYISSFSTAVFCFTQLTRPSAVPGMLGGPQEELTVLPYHLSVPFWDPLSQPEPLQTHRRVRARCRFGALPTAPQWGPEHSRSTSRRSAPPGSLGPAEALRRALVGTPREPNDGQIARAHVRLP